MECGRTSSTSVWREGLSSGARALFLALVLVPAALHWMVVSAVRWCGIEVRHCPVCVLFWALAFATSLIPVVLWRALPRYLVLAYSLPHELRVIRYCWLVRAPPALAA